MERCFDTTFLGTDSKADLEKKQEALYTFSEDFANEEMTDEAAKITVGDLSEAFGEMARIHYDFIEGDLYISWLIKGSEYPRKIMATVPVREAESLFEISDLSELEVVDIRDDVLDYTDRIFKTDAFIGSD